MLNDACAFARLGVHASVKTKIDITIATTCGEFRIQLTSFTTFNVRFDTIYSVKTDSNVVTMMMHNRIVVTAPPTINEIGR